MGSQRVGHDWATKDSTALIHCMHTPQFIYPCSHRWTLGLPHLWLLWIILLWTWVWIYFLELLLSVLSVPRSEITRSYGSSVFNILRNCHTIFHSSLTILHSIQQCTRVQCLHIVINTFLMVVILIGGRLYLTVVLICISLMSEISLHVLIGHLNIFFGEMSI